MCVCVCEPVCDLVKFQNLVGGHSRAFLQKCIITKYLNYNTKSRAEVDVADIEIAVSIVSGLSLF